MSKVVCDLASRQTRLVEPRRNRLAERVVLYPSEARIGECSPKVSGGVR